MKNIIVPKQLNLYKEAATYNYSTRLVLLKILKNRKTPVLEPIDWHSNDAKVRQTGTVTFCYNLNDKYFRHLHTFSKC